MTPGLPPEAEAHYRGYDEDARLDRHGIERDRTQRLREADILDVGGGTGVHSTWLAERGHRVTLVDAMAEHVDPARAHDPFAAEVGEARALAHEDAAFDGVLPLGPLDHLAVGRR